MRWEYMPHMTRFPACFSVLLFSCCVAIAQTPAPGSATTPIPIAVTSDQSPEITRFQKIEDSWADAVNRHDQYGLELVLSPLFMDVAASGDITTRNQQVAQIITGEDKTLFLTQKVITVRMLGDIAVANGTYTLHHRVNSAQVDEKGVFTHVFERLRGGWVCVNSQRTALHENSNAKQKKQSNAEMPFHIPLFSKSDKNNP
jgi:ketosteroid isomerase-like protein